MTEGKAGHNPDKRFLSKGILQMKFMSRSSHVPEESNSNSKRDTEWIVDSGDGSESRQIIIDGRNWSQKVPIFGRVVEKESYMKFENLCEIGRVSSKQFNPYIEKLQAENNRKKNSDDLSDEEEVLEMDGITASEMSSRYTSLVSNKRAPGLGESSDEEDLVSDNNERRKFLKPN